MPKTYTMMVLKKTSLKRKYIYKEGKKKVRKEKEIGIELNEKRRKPWHAASSWQMHS